MIMNKPFLVGRRVSKRYRKIFGLTYKSPRQISLSSMFLPRGYLHLQVIRKQMP